MLEGSLKEFNFGEVLKLAGQTRKTGAIKLKRDDGARGTVYLSDGYIYFAESNVKRKPIGERLVESGKITVKQLNDALNEQKQMKNRVRLGMIMLDKGYISPQDLVDAVQDQILETIFQFFTWKEGSFVFLPGVKAENEDIGIRLDIKNAILKGAERLEHWKSLNRFIPSLDIVFEPADVNDDEKVIVLRPRELKVLRMIDGKRSVRDLIKDAGMSEYELYKILFGMHSAGLIKKKK